MSDSSSGTGQGSEGVRSGVGELEVVMEVKRRYPMSDDGSGLIKI